MTVYYQDEQVTLHAGDCLEVLTSLPESSVDSVVTDPPYGIRFMGNAWDGEDIEARTQRGRETCPMPTGVGGPQGGYRSRAAEAGRYDLSANAAFGEWVQVWSTECLRVLKPGGHMLAFGGSRTWHRLAAAIEDAGFEIRDSIAWLYGSGFPKSLDVSKAIDKAAPRVGMFTDFAAHYADRRAAANLTHAAICKAGGFYAEVNHGGASVNWERGYNVPTPEQWPILQPILGLADEWLPLIERIEADREVTGQYAAGLMTGSAGLTAAGEGQPRRDRAATDAAKQWQGWGTALKPAFEPIVVARKPIRGTVAANVVAHGTGALNIDACRVDMGVEYDPGKRQRQTANSAGMSGLGESGYSADHEQATYNAKGRWPANVVLDGDMADELDKQSGTLTSGLFKGHRTTDKTSGIYGAFKSDSASENETYGDSGGASRFFPTFRYTAKAATSERPSADGVSHPTVKPLELMRWLVRLVTPPGGVVLDPFAGSGTTGEAAIHEHMRAVLIEREPTYLPLIVARLSKPMAVGFDFGSPA